MAVVVPGFGTEPRGNRHGIPEEDGTPLTGAVVQVVGTNNAATAAIDGLYTLKKCPLRPYCVSPFWDTIRSRRRSMPTAWISYSKSAQRNRIGRSDRYAKMDKRIFTGATDQLLASDVKTGRHQ